VAEAIEAGVPVTKLWIDYCLDKWNLRKGNSSFYELMYDDGKRNIKTGRSCQEKILSAYYLLQIKKNTMS